MIAESATPTADDFLKQLEKPTQIKMLEDEWEIDAGFALLSRQLGVVNPFWKRKSPDPKRSLKACGMDDSAIENLIADFRKTSQLAAKLREKLKEKA